jgi:two-component system chemotaxis response regulator CheY
VLAMKILIAEDDLISRRFIEKFMLNYGECDVTVDGIEAIEAFVSALDTGEPYDLICLDVMMPKVDGIKVLMIIRDLEKARGIEQSKSVKILITTALANTGFINNSIQSESEIYVGKPVSIIEMENAMKKLGVLSE